MVRDTMERYGFWIVAIAVSLAALPFLANAIGFDRGADAHEADQVREIRMWVEQTEWEIHPGVTTQVWAFCAEGDGVEPVHDGPCGVPAPTIRATEGDTIRLTFENTHHIPHTVHFHGWHDFAADMNGNALTGDVMVVEPGETQTIEWVAEPTGSFIFHCHFNTNSHMEMGMYGAFIVEDADRPAPDVDHVMVLDEWSIGNTTGFEGAMPVYDYFTINGKSFPLTQPILADPGDAVRLHMVNAGYKFHAMHIHGYTPDSYEGVAGPEHAVRTDVRTVAPGQTVVLDLVAEREGIWLMHDHVVPHVTAAADGDGWGAYPRGMLTVLVVGDDYQAALDDIGPKLLEAARGDVSDPRAQHAGHDHDQDHDHHAHSQASEDPSEQDAQTSGDGVTVAMRDFAYQPKDLRVEPGTTVTWVNEDSAYHTVTLDDGSVDSGQIQAGESFSYTFEEPGTYAYHCTPHAYQDDAGAWQGMVGTVVVEAA